MNRIRLLDIEFIEKLRKDLVSELLKYEGNEKIKLDLSIEELEDLIFTFNCSGARKIAINFELIKKLDLSGVSFDNVDIRHLDFTGSKGVKINPQTVYNKNLTLV